MTSLLRSATLSLALALLAVGVPVPEAWAAARPLTQEAIDARQSRDRAERDERVAKIEAAVDLYRRAVLDVMPGMYHPLIDYAQGPEARSCDPSVAPRTHAILIGADDIGNAQFRLKGPKNDIALMKELLLSLGVGEANVHSLIDERATRSGMAETFLEVLGEVNCDDRVIVHFSGHGYNSRSIAEMSPFSGSDNPYKAEAETMDLSFEDIQKGIVADRIAFEPDMRLFIDNMFNAENVDLALLLNDDDPDRHEIVLGRDVSEYMIAVRNRGAHAITILDAVNAAAASIRDRQRDAGEETSWSFEYVVPGEQAPDEALGLALAPGHGDYAVFYASGAEEVTPELRLPRDDPENQRTLGLFSFVIATAMASTDDPTPRSIALHVQNAYAAENRRQLHPRIDASNANLAIVAETKRPQSGESAIRILSPSPKRGATMVERPEVEIEGVVDWPVRTLGVHLDQQPVAVDETGRFRGKVTLSNGLNRVNVIAVTADSRLHPFTLEFVYEGDRKALEGDGRRLAVIIANQNYAAETGFASLTTPFADADALAEILTGEYGFETTLRIRNQETSLILKDLTKIEVQRALHDIGKAVGERDTVLVFYAGHGHFDTQLSQAYWVLADGENGFEPSYLSAGDISAAVERMNAGNVILISDSCYSGALLRGGTAEAEDVASGERMQALLRLQSRRSRVIITSGNNEPVDDLGGKGHSVFARALLTGLRTMEHEAFSARELFDDYILHAVTANADQEPQYRPLEKVGHEGGDFVFVRKRPEMATAD